MGMLDWMFGEVETRAEPTPTNMEETVSVSAGKSDSEDDLNFALQGGNVKNTVNRTQAMNVPIVASAINLIASVVAGIPIRLYKKGEDGAVEEITEDNRLALLNLDTGAILSAVETKTALVMDLLLEGECYAFLGKTGNTIRNVQYIPQNTVSVLTNNGVHIDRVITYLIDGHQYTDFNVMRVVRNSKDGYQGCSVLDESGLLMATMYNSLMYENMRMSKGGRRGFLMSESRLKKSMLDNLRNAWRKLYDNNDNSDVMVLNKGLKFEAADNTAVENQLKENKAINSDLMYKAFGLTEDTFKNEDAFRIFVKTAVMPVVNLLTNAFNRSLLLEEEKVTHYFSFDTNQILKADMLARYQAYKVALNSHWMNIDEVRKEEDLKPLGIDFVGLGLQDILYYPETKRIYIPNMGKGDTIGQDAGKGVITDEGGNQK